jgi:acyl-CoA reductase-like NAD-dependent aldehyde dehydrogenase
MANQPNATAMPPVEVVLSEVVASLTFAAHAYLTPLEAGAPAELDAADMAIDVAGRAFERIQSRLQPEERSAFARSLTDLRLTYVKKRGL